MGVPANFLFLLFHAIDNYVNLLGTIRGKIKDQSDSTLEELIVEWDRQISKQLIKIHCGSA